MYLSHPFFLLLFGHRTVREREESKVPRTVQATCVCVQKVRRTKRRKEKRRKRGKVKMLFRIQTEASAVNAVIVNIL